MKNHNLIPTLSHMIDDVFSNNVLGNIAINENRLWQPKTNILELENSFKTGFINTYERVVRWPKTVPPRPFFELCTIVARTIVQYARIPSFELLDFQTRDSFLSITKALHSLQSFAVRFIIPILSYIQAFPIYINTKQGKEKEGRPTNKEKIQATLFVKLSSFQQVPLRGMSCSYPGPIPQLNEFDQCRHFRTNIVGIGGRTRTSSIAFAPSIF